MKKLDILIIKSFIGPFIVTFVVSIFFLLMQFLWLWVEDLIGKGLHWSIILKLLYYASANLVPLALPLAVLLASVMTFGNLGEHFELTAMKSSGISLRRIMASLVLFIFSMSIGAFFFSNHVLPYTNLQYATLLYDITQKNPELSIKTGVFNNDITGYSIKIEDKNPETGMIYKFMIYNHSGYQGNKDVTLADSGRIRITEDRKNMVVTLYDGYNYKDMEEKNSTQKKYPFRSDKFKQQTIIFELPDNSLKNSDEDLFKKHYEIMNSEQLAVVIDSLDKEYHKNKFEYDKNLLEFSYFQYDTKISKQKDSAKFVQDSLQKNQPPEQLAVNFNTDSVFNQLAPKNKQSILQEILKKIGNQKNDLGQQKEIFKSKREWLLKHELAWYKKYSLSFACLIFFFIGAPLGSIIRKGGFGMPILISVVLFMFYYILFTVGQKSVISGTIPVEIGAWLASFVLFPLGIFITYKATRDAKIVDAGSFKQILSFITAIFKRRPLK